MLPKTTTNPIATNTRLPPGRLPLAYVITLVQSIGCRAANLKPSLLGGGMPGRLEHPAAHAVVQWQHVGESVLAGVCHTLNSRITALWGVAELLSADVTSESLMALLRAELQRLEQLARLLHWLPRRPGRGVEPISLADLLPELIELHREHHGLDRIRVELE